MEIAAGCAAALSSTEQALPAQGRADDIYDRIYERYQAYKAKHDFVILEGSHRGARLPIHVFGGNDRVAQHMEACAALVAAVSPFSFSTARRLGDVRPC